MYNYLNEVICELRHITCDFAACTDQVDKVCILGEKYPKQPRYEYVP